MSETYNLERLYEMQKTLDARIIKEKGLEGQDLLPNTVLALQVEIAELANEWRGFKHWSNDREPRTRKIHQDRDAYLETNPLLEEYVDCLHFFLSIARQINFEIGDITWQMYNSGVTEHFLELFRTVSAFWLNSDHFEFECALRTFLAIAEPMGFTWEQIAAAYIAKNKTNHDRQSNGY